MISEVDFQNQCFSKWQGSPASESHIKNRVLGSNLELLDQIPRRQGTGLCMLQKPLRCFLKVLKFDNSSSSFLFSWQPNSHHNCWSLVKASSRFPISVWLFCPWLQSGGRNKHPCFTSASFRLTDLSKGSGAKLHLTYENTACRSLLMTAHTIQIWIFWKQAQRMVLWRQA